MSTKKPNFRVTIDKLMTRFSGVRRYGLAVFIVFISLLYGFVLFRINSLNSAQPSQDAIAAQVKAARVPHIDQAAIQQLQSLQDNSVSVQTLFNEARSNPFQ